MKIPVPLPHGGRLAVRARLLVLAAALYACVPTTDESEPKGAIGYTVDATPASKGAPLQTEDGFVITIERMVVDLSVGVLFRQGTLTTSGPVEDNGLLFPATTSATIFARAVPVGSWSVSLQFGSRFGQGDQGKSEVATLDLASGEAQRFAAAADVASRRSDPPLQPNLLLVARGTRGSRTTRFNIAFHIWDVFLQAREGTRVVRANELVTSPAKLRGEMLFSSPTGAVRFASFEQADRDLDGVLTVEELNRGAISDAEVEEAQAGDVVPRVSTLAGLVMYRAATALLEH